jgi:hypothetical protein
MEANLNQFEFDIIMSIRRYYPIQCVNSETGEIHTIDLDHLKIGDENSEQIKKIVHEVLSEINNKN